MSVRRILVALAGLTISVAGQQATEGTKVSRERVFVSPDKSFEFAVPATYSLYEGKDVTKGIDSYIPLCHKGAVVCAVYPGDQYKGTNFESAAFEVKVIPVETEKACLTPRQIPISGAPNAPTVPEFEASPTDPTRTINGVRFLHAFDKAAAMSHDVETNLYRGFRNGCYELDVGVTYSNFLVWAPGMIKEFTKQDDEQVTASLIKIADSFKILR